MNLGDQIVDLFQRYPILGVLLRAMVTCWLVAGLIRLVTL